MSETVTTFNPSSIPDVPADETTPVHLHVALKPGIYQKYLRQSIDKGRPLSTVLSDRIAKYVDSTDEKPIVFTDADRRELEKLMKRNFSTSAEVLQFLRAISAIEIGGMKVQFYPKLLERLQSRALNQPLDTFVSKVVVQALEEYVGLR